MTALPPAVSVNRYRSEPVWWSVRRVRRGQVPAGLRSWLLETPSLTQGVIAACGGRFRVRVLAQEWTRPMPNECRRLGIRPSARALVRQVQLLCDDVPWVYARTVIPRATLRGRARRLAWLGSRSLGATLFADRAMRRSPLELARLTPRDSLHARIATLGVNDRVLWGRRSIFTLANKPLLVSEIFLPAIAEDPF